MIEIGWSGNYVTIHVETGLYGDASQKIITKMDCGSSLCAELLCKRLRDRLSDTVEAIRKREYNDGIKTGRAKAKKRDYFYTIFKDQTY